MSPARVIAHEVERYCRAAMIEPVAESIRQPPKCAYLYSHGLTCE